MEVCANIDTGSWANRGKYIHLHKGNENQTAQVLHRDLANHLTCPSKLRSSGPDELHPTVLKELMDALTEPPTIIFEKFWKTGKT